MPISIQILELSECAEHIPILTEWFWQQWGRYRVGSSKEKISARLHTFLNEGSIPFTLVAIANGIPAGTASVRPDDMAIRPHLQPWLASVYVDENFRKLGIGSQLIIEAERRAQIQGFDVLYLYTPDKAHLYERLGWTELERVWYHAQEMIVMSKCLTGLADDPA
jgi:GNAT superfamily N-acetyltransferase